MNAVLLSLIGIAMIIAGLGAMMRGMVHRRSGVSFAGAVLAGLGVILAVFSSVIAQALGGGS